MRGKEVGAVFRLHREQGKRRFICGGGMPNLSTPHIRLRIGTFFFLLLLDELLCFGLGARKRRKHQDNRGDVIASRLAPMRPALYRRGYHCIGGFTGAQGVASGGLRLSGQATWSVHRTLSPSVHPVQQ